MDKTFAFSLRAALMAAVLFGFVIAGCWKLACLCKSKQEIAEGFVRGYQGQAIGLDPWGNKYVVEKESTEGTLTVLIVSAGQDGKFGTQDDIRGGYRRDLTVEVIENE